MDSEKKQVDTTFGIRYDNDNTVIDDDDDDEVYVGTPGLWSLITDKVPKNYMKEIWSDTRGC